MLTMEHFTPPERAELARRASEIPERIRRAFRRIPGLARSVIACGGNYNGIWLECNQEVYFLSRMFPEAAWGSTEVFMEFQMRSGLIPHCVKFDPVKISFAQLQSVWPFARSAFEIVKQTGRSEEDLRRVYDCAAAYDRWLAANRDHTGTGLVELYCGFDAGQDKCLRAMTGGMTEHCPGLYAGNMPDLPCMPLIGADLSAMRYGGLVALAEMAERLDLPGDAADWRSLAAGVKAKIHELLYDSEDEFFYDRAPSGFRKFRTIHITRMFLNRVVDRALFDRIYHRYFENENEFLTPWPFPAVSVSDPIFEKDPVKNCWGRNVQALTLIRSLLWMDHYGRGGDQEKLMSRVLRHYLEHPEDEYTQEIDPFDGGVIRPNGKDCVNMMVFFLISCRRLGITGGCYSSEQPLV